jgi:hypothetical protein
MSMGVDRELLAQRELNDRLVMATPEQGDDAPEDRDRESRRSRHRTSDSARVVGAKGD